MPLKKIKLNFASSGIRTSGRSFYLKFKMPKKPPRNSFYFFMIDFREEQRKKGINYANMPEVAAAAGPLWQEAPPGIRVKYDAIAKQEKNKHNIPEKKFTSTGISFAEIEQQEKEQKEAAEAERKDILNFVKLKAFNNDILRQDIFLMDVNSYCQVSGDYIIGESTVLRFNLQDGVRDYYHENINPGVIPVGYASDMKIASKELGLSMPYANDTPAEMNYKERILAQIIDYLTEQGKVKTLPAIFTMPEKVAEVQNFIYQMCLKAEEYDRKFRVYRLDTLFYTLTNAIRKSNDEGFPKESLALAQLKKDNFKYNPGLGCVSHEEADLSIECTTSRTKRWAFTVLDICCPIIGIPVEPGKHVPPDYDMDTILTYKEQKRERAAPSVAGNFMAPGSSNNSVVDDTYSESASTVNLEPKKERVHKPLRMPKTDYSQAVRIAPELTEDNFPKLTAGRGRGLGGSFNKLKLDK